MDPARLDEHIRFFKRRGYRFVRAGELCRSASGEDAKVVCLTFDDAYESALTNGQTVLERHGIVATFYAVPQYVGLRSEWDGDLADRLADWEALTRAKAAGHEIGNHTWSHQDLTQLDEEAQLESISRGHSALADRGLTPDTVCYPYGHCGQDTLAAAGNLYRIGLAIGRWPDYSSPLAYSRIVIACRDGLAKLLYKLYVRPYLP